MDAIAALVTLFPPSATHFLDVVRRGVNDAMLMDIATADYGYQADAVLVLLRSIRDHGTIPTPMDGQLSEVLSLTRWHNPDRPNSPPFNPGPAGHSGHVTRLFACAVLLTSSLRWENAGHDRSDDSSWAMSLVSAARVSEQMSHAIGSFLTWRLSQPDGISNPVLFGLALLTVALRSKAKPITETLLVELTDHVLQIEAAITRNIAMNSGLPEPPIPFSLQQGFWDPIADELNAAGLSIQNENLRTNLQLCALYLKPW